MLFYFLQEVKRWGVFRVSDYTHFLYILLFYGDLFDRIVNIAVSSRQVFLIVDDEYTGRNIHLIKNAPFTVSCLCVRLDTSIFVYISGVNWQSTMFRDSQVSAHETNI